MLQFIVIVIDNMESSFRKFHLKITIVCTKAKMVHFPFSPVHWFHISQQDIVRYNGAKMCQLNHDLVKVKESFIFLLYFQKHVLLSLWRLHNVHIIFTIHL